jgi:hypothetical protein
MKTFLRFTGILLLAAGMLTLSGCKEPDENKVEPGLVGSWSNRERGDDLKTFTIQLNGKFSADLNPSGADGPGTVTGVLIKEGNEYMMNNMVETTGKGWGGGVSLYNRTYVQITLSDNDNIFDLECEDDPIVKTFFGGRYFKQPAAE